MIASPIDSTPSRSRPTTRGRARTLTLAQFEEGVAGLDAAAKAAHGVAYADVGWEEQRVVLAFRDSE